MLFCLLLSVDSNINKEVKKLTHMKLLSLSCHWAKISPNLTQKTCNLLFQPIETLKIFKSSEIL